MKAANKNICGKTAINITLTDCYRLQERERMSQKINRKRFFFSVKTLEFYSGDTELESLPEHRIP
jgi:hypothetical protein